MNVRNLVSVAAQLVILLGLLFGPAWTFNYWQGWIYLLVTVGVSASAIAYFKRKDPRLLERRTRGFKSEKATSQRLLQLLVVLVFSGSMLLSSFDHRFSWSHVPLYAVLAGYAIVVAGYFIIFRVFSENTFAAVNIAVETNQTVISTGPYAIVRHPMYTGLLALEIGTPLALGSWWGLLMVVPLAAAIVLRIRHEESYLSENLPGYADYLRSIRHRVVPFIW